MAPKADQQTDANDGCRNYRMLSDAREFRRFKNVTIQKQALSSHAMGHIVLQDSHQCLDSH